ncbi:MAG: 2OG-Fe(II) oxygenase family protein [Alphaproteobacteria bacterium]
MTRPLGWGEPAPWFFARAPINPQFAFSSLAGRFVALTFFGGSDVPMGRAFLEAVAAAAIAWDDAQLVSFGVSADEADLDSPMVRRAFPHNRVFHDPGRQIASGFGLVPAGETSGPMQLRWFVLDPTLRVYASGGLDQPGAFLATLASLPQAEAHSAATADPWAPVLLVPRVLEPELCRHLVEAYEHGAPRASGFMRTENGRTVGKLDESFKRRADVTIEDAGMRAALREAIRARLVPEIRKVFQFEVTRIERYIVACYDGASHGFFKAHRDNTTAGTAHRRFAVTINLNAEEFDGGELRFPEFGPRTYRAPTGGAVVFSCSLLHEAMPVTRGLRYATLPFLYDEAAAMIREQNIALLDDGSASYRASG